MPTLEDVARRAGVSTATVSKVLSNTPYFTAATKARVMAAVDELGYVPNLAARALAAGKTHVLAVVFPYVYDPIFNDPLVLRILEGIEAESRAHGYNILLSTPHLTDDGPDEHYRRLMASGYMDGVIALDNVPFASVAHIGPQKAIPTVGTGYHPSPYSVRSDDYAGGRQQMEHILQLGHERIGLISVPERVHFAAAERLRGGGDVAAAAGIDFARLPVALGDFSTGSGERAVAHLLAAHPDLTAIICLNDRMAMGAAQQARRLGRRVGKDLAVIGYDDIPMASVFDPPLTTIDQHGAELGRALAALLFELLRGAQPTSRVFPVDLVVRESTCPPA